jgi:hypothetical protein
MIQRARHDPTEYGLNVGRFARDHPGWRITAGPAGTGYSAQRRTDAGVSGPRIDAQTLDELAARLADADRAG